MTNVCWRFTQLVLVSISQIAIGERKKSFEKYSIRDNKMTFQNSKIIANGLQYLNMSMLVACSVLVAFDLIRVIRKKMIINKLAYDVEEVKILKQRDKQDLGSFFIDCFFQLCTMVLGFGTLSVMSFLFQEAFDKDLSDFSNLCTGTECDILLKYYWQKTFQEVFILAFPLIGFGIEIMNLSSKIIRYFLERSCCPRWMKENEYRVVNAAANTLQNNRIVRKIGNVLLLRYRAHRSSWIKFYTPIYRIKLYS